MDRETLILVIAQNGLKAAATFLAAKAAKAEKDAEKAKEKDAAKSVKLAKDATKTKKLAAVLASADEGIAAYLVKTVE